MFAAVSAGGGAIGLLAGGMLVEWLNWRWVLFVNVPIGLLIAFATPRWIKESERRPGHFDVTGALTSTAGMVLLVYGFIRAAQEGWRDALTLASFAAAVVVLTVFVLVERRSRQPITPLHMFADRNRAGTYGIMLCLAAAMFGMFFFLTLFVQNVLGFGPLRAGLAFLPVSAVIAIGAGLASRFLPVYGPKPFMVLGGVLAAAGLAWLTLTDVHSTYAGSVLGPMLVFSLGMGMEFVSLTLMALSDVAPEESGAASGLLNATQQVGGSLGLSILVTVFGTASAGEAERQIPRFLQQATPAERLRFERTGDLPPPWGDEVLTAGVSAAFVMAAIFAVAAALIALVAIQVRPSDLERLQGAAGPGPGPGEPASGRGGASSPGHGPGAVTRLRRAGRRGACAAPPVRRRRGWRGCRRRRRRRGGRGRRRPSRPPRRVRSPGVDVGGPADRGGVAQVPGDLAHRPGDGPAPGGLAARDGPGHGQRHGGHDGGVPGPEVLGADVQAGEFPEVGVDVLPLTSCQARRSQ